MYTDFITGAAQAVTTAEGDLPTRIELMPIGDVELADRRGKVGKVTDADALVERSMEAAKGGMLPIDFGHGLDGLAGADPRAAGWITGLSVEGDRIMADVEWTPPGAQALREKTFRFISPVFNAFKETGELAFILRAGLTNDPALPQLAQLASSERTSDMPDWHKKLAGIFGLPEDATEDQITAAAQGAVTQLALLKPAITAAGLTGDVTAEGATALMAKITASSAAKPDPAKFVPIEAFNEMQTQLATAQAGIAEDRVATIVASAMQEGKVAPAMKDWATDYATKDLAGFEKWAASAPVLASAKPQTPAGDPPASKASALTEQEVHVCSEMGISQEAYLATKNAGQAPAATKEA